MLCHSLTTKIDGGANLRGGNQAFNIISVAVITTGVVGHGATWGKLKARTKIKKKKEFKDFWNLGFSPSFEFASDSLHFPLLRTLKNISYTLKYFLNVVLGTLKIISYTLKCFLNVVLGTLKIIFLYVKNFSNRLKQLFLIC